LVAVAAIAGCTKTWRAHTTQPNPLTLPNETLRESEEVVIITGDMELNAPQNHAPYGSQASVLVEERYPLVNKARFTVVSRDRLRVHVQLEHKWKEYVDVRNWRGYLVDDRGRVYEPVDVDQSRDQHIVVMWDYEARSVRRNRYGDVVEINDDGYKDRQTLGSLSVFRGQGDFVFYGQNIFSEDVKALTFVIERRGLAFEFTWKFDDRAAAPVTASR
jgi:hypothetical protein